MKRPVYLKRELFDFISKTINCTPVDHLRQQVKNCGYSVSYNSSKKDIAQVVLKSPASFLECHGLLNNFEWLVNLVIELDDEVEYLITELAAEQLCSGDDSIVLTRLIDKRETVVTRVWIEKALRNNNTIDYVESLERKRKGGP